MGVLCRARRVASARCSNNAEWHSWLIGPLGLGFPSGNRRQKLTTHNPISKRGISLDLNTMPMSRRSVGYILQGVVEEVPCCGSGSNGRVDIVLSKRYGVPCPSPEELDGRPRNVNG